MASALITTPADPTSGHWEGVNPTRRYRWFRPRQAAWAAASTTSATNRPVVFLYNNSPNQYIVIRSVLVSPAQNGTVNGAIVQGGNTGTPSNAVVPFIGAEGLPPGQLFVQDTTDVTPFIFSFTPSVNVLTQLMPIYPLAILPFGYSLRVWLLLNTQTITVSYLYEHIYPDELDFFW